MDEIKLKEINRNLIKEFGRYGDGRPHWRLIRNHPGYTEKRHGEFLTHYPITMPDGLVIEIEDVVEDTREVPKYNWIREGIYILEQLYFGNRPQELVMAQDNNRGDYELRWAFMNADGVYMEPMWEGCKFLVEAVRSVHRDPIETREQYFQRLKQEDLKKLEPTVIPAIPLSINEGHGVFMDAEKRFESVSSSDSQSDGSGGRNSS